MGSPGPTDTPRTTAGWFDREARDELARLAMEVARLERQRDGLARELSDRERLIARLNAENADLAAELAGRASADAEQRRAWRAREAELAALADRVGRDRESIDRDRRLAVMTARMLDRRAAELDDLQCRLDDRRGELDDLESELDVREQELERSDRVGLGGGDPGSAARRAGREIA